MCALPRAQVWRPYGKRARPSKLAPVFSRARAAPPSTTKGAPAHPRCMAWVQSRRMPCSAAALRRGPRQATQPCTGSSASPAHSARAPARSARAAREWVQDLSAGPLNARPGLLQATPGAEDPPNSHMPGRQARSGRRPGRQEYGPWAASRGAAAAPSTAWPALTRGRELEHLLEAVHRGVQHAGRARPAAHLPQHAVRHQARVGHTRACGAPAGGPHAGWHSITSVLQADGRPDVGPGLYALG